MKIKNFGIIKGKSTTITDGRILYSPLSSEELDESSINAEHADEIRSSEVFSNGILEFKAKIENPKTSLLIIWNEDGKILSSIGHSYHHDAFLIVDGSGAYYDKAGSLNNYESNQELKFKIEAFGSKAKLFINEVLLLESYFTPKSLPILFRIFSKGKLSIYDINIEKKKPKLFVVMQFSENFNTLYNEVIKPVAEKEGFECIRADEYYTSTPIIADIVKSIEESFAIIAEITHDNPNVFYEIGYAHAISKPTILLCDRTRNTLPFDISNFRTLFYENSISGKSAVEVNLQKYLENIK